jgi:hypothetical protein
MLTSKGASGITGAGFITLAATLAVVNPALVPGMAIVLGNLCGRNGRQREAAVAAIRGNSLCRGLAS